MENTFWFKRARKITFLLGLVKLLRGIDNFGCKTSTIPYRLRRKNGNNFKLVKPLRGIDNSRCYTSIIPYRLLRKDTFRLFAGNREEIKFVLPIQLPVGHIVL